jgi:phosphoglucomutase
MSPEFSEEAARVLCANGVKAYVFDSLRPTPLLSFAVRHLKATAGIVITASHNPPEYNGYKVYWTDGGQTPFPRDEEIIDEVNRVSEFSQIKTMSREDAVKKGLYLVARPEVDDAFIENVKACCLNPALIPESDLTVVYTPLHGTGSVPVQRALKETGFKNIYVVPEQEQPDGDFSTVASPNPENRKAYALALALAAEKNADIVIATDPDADRVGVAAKDADGEYALFTGNMTGTLLLEYLLSQRKEKGMLPENGAVISTIVSTALARKITEAYGLKYFNVLTGFKYIGEKIKQFEESGRHTYLFGFEESYGCLSGTYARDKDAVAASLLVCDMAAYYRAKGMTLCGALDAMYEKYGYFKESVESVALAGVEGSANIRRIMTALREHPPKTLAGTEVLVASDYKNETVLNIKSNTTHPTALPVSDVLHYALADGSWACVRPSGTEPTIKLYFGVCEETAGLNTAKRNADVKLKALAADVKAIVDGVLKK